MACGCCGGSIKKGQYFIVLKAFVRTTNAYGKEEALPVVMEDGSVDKTAHYGCLMKKEPALVGVNIGEPKDG